MAFIFTMRSTPVGGMHRRDLTSSTSLPVIDEDGTSFPTPQEAPPVPPRASNRPAHKIFALGRPPRHNFEGSPPAYTHFDESVRGPNGEKLSEVRRGLGDNKHIAKRGGWKRLALIGVIAALIIIGLIVGLVVGLRNRNRSSSNTANDSSSTSGGASGSIEPGPTQSNHTFPAGSYSFDTYLNTVATNCTSNPATWSCYPYLTHAQSATQSAATFDWIINPVDNSANHTISSTSNPFSIMFSNVSLALMREGQDDEHYFFQTSMQKPTKPAAPLSDKNVVATCYFNDTTFQGYLYTKIEKTYPPADNTTDSNGAFSAWPYAVKIEQVAGARAGTPECVDPAGKSLGDFSVENQTQLCDCLYMNTGT